MSYRLIVTYGMGIEIPWRTRIGPGLRVYHGVGLVINDHTTLGRDVTLRQGVTIGHSKSGGGCPTVEDEVEFGANAIALGPITIGRGAIVGAGAVVTKDVPAGARVVGNPARILG